MILGLPLTELGALTIRKSTVSVVPIDPLPLGGYTERKGANFVPSGDKLYVRVTLINDIAFVAFDSLTIPQDFYLSVQKALPKYKIFLAATHTHCAPDSQMLNPKMTFSIPGIASYRPKIAQWYQRKIVGSVVQAEDSKPELTDQITLQFGRAKLNHARRSGARPDQTTWLISAGNQPILAAYAAHATFHEPDTLNLNGDWPGVLAKMIEAPVFPGAIGDVSPESSGKNADERCVNFAKVFLDSFLVSKKVVVCRDSDKLKFELEPIALDLPQPSPTFAKSYGVPDSLAQTLVKKFAETRANLTGVRLGNFAVIGVPGEPSAELGSRIRKSAKEMGFADGLVVSHTNGWIGYILMPSDFDRGGYEANLSFHGRNTALKVLESARRLLKKLSHGRSSHGRGSAKAYSSGQKSAS